MWCGGGGGGGEWGGHRSRDGPAVRGRRLTATVSSGCTEAVSVSVARADASEDQVHHVWCWRFVESCCCCCCCFCVVPDHDDADALVLVVVAERRTSSAATGFSR